MLLAGEGGARDPGAARQWLERAAQKNDPEAKALLATVFLLADKESRDVRKAETLLHEAATSGFPIAAMQLGHLYAGRYDVAARPEDALRWYTIAAEAGQSEAQYILGVMYRHGSLVPKDAAKAAEWLTKAAESGLAGAQFDSGVMFCTGEGVEKDVARGAELYRLAAEGGHVDGMHNWGVMRYRGIGVEADETAGMEWIERAKTARTTNAPALAGA